MWQKFSRLLQQKINILGYLAEAFHGDESYYDAPKNIKEIL